MQKITKKLRKPNQISLLHDTKSDIATLAKYCNLLADTINDLIDELERTKAELDKLKEGCKT